MVESINVDSEMSKILIVDDNDDLRTIMKIMLREFEVVEAKNGKEAIELFNESKPDLVLMDILMPVMDGIEATEIIMEK
ncbi:MAG: response regulator, partial [Candidatus Heimdallarchaeota archaeon]